MNNKAPNIPLSFSQHQAIFSAYVKNPQHNPAPADVPTERMALYAELIFNNIEGFLSNNFPVLNAILGAERWLQLVRDFFSQHRCATPYFAQIPEEFLSYLQEERNNPDDYPFLLELAHYEWVEMALAIAPAELQLNALVDDILHQPLTLSPLAWPLAYHYPVHQLSPEFLPLQAPETPTLLLVYRNQWDRVKFVQINALSYYLLTAIQEHPGQSASAYLQQITQELPNEPVELLVSGGLSLLQDLATKHILTFMGKSDLMKFPGSS